jgi:glycine/D-amino acid oxidase-like deaminating enzyme
MRILITTCTYPPQADGVAEAAAVLARGLARRGHDVTVVTEFQPDRKPDAPDASPRVMQFKLTGNASWRIGVQGGPEERAAYQNFPRAFAGGIASAHPVLEKRLGQVRRIPVRREDGFCLCGRRAQFRLREKRFRERLADAAQRWDHAPGTIAAIKTPASCVICSKLLSNHPEFPARLSPLPSSRNGSSCR